MRDYAQKIEQSEKVAARRHAGVSFLIGLMAVCAGYALLIVTDMPAYWLQQALHALADYAGMEQTIDTISAVMNIGLPIFAALIVATSAATASRRVRHNT